MEERDWIVFYHQLRGVGSVTLKKLYQEFGNLTAASRCSESEWERRGIAPHVIKQRVMHEHDCRQIVDRLYEEHARFAVQILTYADLRYPSMLKEIYDPPYVLFCQGKIDAIQENMMISVVGTRQPSYYGKWAAKELGRFLAEHQIPVVSGLARGIDKHVHESVLYNHGTCVAVVGTGLNEIYPAEHKVLYQRIVDSGGCVLSEYPVFTKAKPGHFPARNRIISGLSLGTVVVESKIKGGALITADQALEQNREVFAVPGNINSPNSEGTNTLIKQGAKPLIYWSDIFDELPAFAPAGKISTQTAKEELLTDPENAVLALIPYTPIHIDSLTDSYREHDLHLCLIQLQLKGYIEQLSGQQYVRL